MTATNMCSNFGGSGVVPPLRNVAAKLEGSSHPCKNTHGSFLMPLIMFFLQILFATKRLHAGLESCEFFLLVYS